MSNISNLAQNMRDLRSKYDDSITAIGNLLQLPKSIGRAKIEALLIMAVEECFVSDALRRDIVLMAIGLAKGYGRHGQIEQPAAPSDRYAKFIEESIYIQLTPTIKYGSYEEAKKAGADVLETICETLGTKAGRNINKVARFLEEHFKDGEYTSYAEASAKKYPSSYRDYIPDEELPSLINIREDTAASIPSLHLLPIPADIYERETYEGSVPSSDSAWSDNSASGQRRGYMTKQVEAGILGDSVVFNSIYDGKLNKGYDFDERNFISIRNIPNIPHANPGEWHTKEIVAKNGLEYEIRCYIRNDNPGGHGAEAKDTRVSIIIPKEDSSATGSITIKGYIQSSNAEPDEYCSSVRFVGDQRPFSLEYIPGSARLYNSGIGSSAEGFPLNDSIVAEDAKNGILIGYDALDGVIPGGLGYASYVTMRVTVEDFIKHEVTGRVRAAGSRKWEKCVTDVAVGDKLEFQFEFRNNSALGEIMENVTLKVILPANMCYAAGSARLWTADCSGAKIDSYGELIDVGVNIGDYAPDTNAVVRFTAEVVKGCVESTRMIDVCYAEVQKGNTTVMACASVMYR